MNVLITGATKGIGRAVTEEFASHGAAVAICARNGKELDEFAGHLKAVYGIEVLQKVCDVSNKESVHAFAGHVKKHWEQLNVLINNAGTYLPGRVIDEEEGALEHLIKTNLYSAYNLTRAALPLMLPFKSGHIFNLCSVASLNAYPDGGSYSVSKFALLGFSKALREELKPHKIGVTSLIPGAVLTSSWDGVDLPESRFIDVKDVAKLVYDIYSLSSRTVVEDIVIRPMEGDI